MLTLASLTLTAQPMGPRSVALSGGTRRQAGAEKLDLTPGNST